MSNTQINISPKDHTLLVVDDEEDLREILSMSLIRSGFNVLEAGNGKEAFEIIKSKKIDLVISDIQMPKGNGVELLENLRNEHHELPVLLFITGFSDISVEDAYNKGADAIFSKPFNYQALLNAVCSALEPKELRWKGRPWRGETTLPIEVRLTKVESARSGKVFNIGRGGMFLAFSGTLPKISEVINFKIHFTEEKATFIEGQGIVRWLREEDEGEFLRGFGVEFQNLTDQASCKVIEIINFIKTKQYIPKN